MRFRIKMNGKRDKLFGNSWQKWSLRERVERVSRWALFVWFIV